MEFLAFCLLSLPLLALSRRWLFRPAHHGFYRFILFECILWLAIANRRHLLVERFDLQQVAASVLMLASLGFVLAAVITLRARGGTGTGRDDPGLFAFERTTVLIRTGIFRFVRHPMYGSLLFLAWGLLLRRVESNLLVVAAAATAAAARAGRIEERENIAYWGDAYLSYMRRTKRFVPFVI